MSATRPNVSVDAVVHFAAYPSKEGGLCADIRDDCFGALWHSPHGPDDHHTFVADGNDGGGFRFTHSATHVTCPKCLAILKSARPKEAIRRLRPPPSRDATLSAPDGRQYRVHNTTRRGNVRNVQICLTRDDHGRPHWYDYADLVRKGWKVVR